MEGDDQLFHDLEQRYLVLKNERDAIYFEKESLKGKLESYEASSSEIKQHSDNLQRELAQKDSLIKQKESLEEDLTRSVREIQHKLQQQVDENKMLKDDLKLQASELASVQGLYRTAQESLSDLQFKQLPTQFELTKAQRERDLLKAHVDGVEKELSTKAQELSELRRNHANEIESLSIKMTALERDLESKSNALKSSQDRVSLQAEKVDHLLVKLSEAETSLASQQINFSQEVDSLKKMADLYKRHFEDATSRVEDLEQTLASAKDAYAAGITQLKERAAAGEVELRGSYEREVASLVERVAELQEQLRTRGSGAPVVEDSTEGVRRPEADAVNSPAPYTFSTGLDMGPTEMFGRIATAERALVVEQSKRKELELYLNKILADVESKAPAILTQKRDYSRIVESHGQLTTRLNQLAVDNSSLKDTVRQLEAKTKAALEEVQATRVQNADLSTQLQHLLKKRIEEQYGSLGSKQKPAVVMDTESPTSADDVISAYLLTFDDITELQTKNAQLVQVVRKLSQEQENAIAEAQSSGRDQETANALAVALQELNTMRESRLRTEDMLSSLVQQRDMYRAMLDEADAAKSAYKPTTPGSASKGFSSPVAAGGRSALSSPIASMGSAAFDLQNKVSKLEEENKNLRDRLTRLEDVERLVGESLDQARKEANTLRLDVAGKTSEARFQKERADRLEDSLHTSQAEITALSQRKYDVEKTVTDLQKEIRLKEEKILTMVSSMNSAEESLRRAQIDLEVSKASETRLVAQLNEQREEVKRQVAFGDSIRRIEAGLTSRAEEERSSLVQERENALRSLEQLRKQAAEKEAVAEQRILTLEDDVKTLRSVSDTKTMLASSLKEDLIREQNLTKAAQERASILEKQLSAAQERLGSLQGSQFAGSTLATDLEDRDIAIEQANATIESLKSQLQSAEAHAEQFRRIGVSTEACLKELRERSAETKEAFDAEVNRLKEEIASLHADLVRQRDSSIVSLQEIEQARDTVRNQAIEHQAKISSLDEVMRLQKQQLEQSASQLDQLQADIAKHIASAKQAHSNYERELQLHAISERTLREREDELDSVKSALLAEQRKFTELSAVAIRHESVLAEEKKRSEAVVAEHLQQISDLKTTNDLLHNQVQSLSHQINKLLEARVAGAEGNSGEGSDNNATSSSNADEARDLRELIRYLKREKDVLESKLAISESEGNRHLSSLASTQRQLDEVRGELKREHELRSRQPAHSEEEYARLLSDSSQLKLTLESNAHLRTEYEATVKRVASLTESLQVEQKRNAPLLETLRTLTSEKEALTDANETLLNDCTYWKDRLHQLVSRYNDIDPEEHRLLQVKVATLEQSLAAAVASAAETAAANNKALAAVQAELEVATKEVASLQVSKQRVEENCNTLREKLRGFKTVIDQSSKRATEAEKLVGEQKAEIEKLNQAATAASEAAKAAAAAAPPVPAGAPRAGAAATRGGRLGKAVPRPPVPATPATAPSPSTPGTPAAATTASVPTTPTPPVAAPTTPAATPATPVPAAPVADAPVTGTTPVVATRVPVRVVPAQRPAAAAAVTTSTAAAPVAVNTSTAAAPDSGTSAAVTSTANIRSIAPILVIPTASTPIVTPAAEVAVPALTTPSMSIEPVAAADKPDKEKNLRQQLLNKAKTAPVAAAPVTAAPVTAAPVIAAPVIAAPVTAAPVTAAPVTVATSTPAPVAASPVTIDTTDVDEHNSKRMKRVPSTEALVTSSDAAPVTDGSEASSSPVPEEETSSAEWVEPASTTASTASVSASIGFATPAAPSEEAVNESRQKRDLESPEYSPAPKSLRIEAEVELDTEADQESEDQFLSRPPTNVDEEGETQREAEEQAMEEEELSRSDWGSGTGENSNERPASSLNLQVPSEGSDAEGPGSPAVPPSSPFLERMRPPSPSGPRPVFGSGRVTSLPVPSLPLPSPSASQPATTPSTFSFGSQMAPLTAPPATAASNSTNVFTSLGNRPSVFNNKSAPAGTAMPSASGGLFGAPPRVMSTTMFSANASATANATGTPLFGAATAPAASSAIFGSVQSSSGGALVGSAAAAVGAQIPIFGSGFTGVTSSTSTAGGFGGLSSSTTNFRMTPTAAGKGPVAQEQEPIAEADFEQDGDLFQEPMHDSEVEMEQSVEQSIEQDREPFEQQPVGGSSKIVLGIIQSLSAEEQRSRRALKFRPPTAAVSSPSVSLANIPNTGTTAGASFGITSSFATTTPTTTAAPVATTSVIGGASVGQVEGRGAAGPPIRGGRGRRGGRGGGRGPTGAGAGAGASSDGKTEE